MNETVDCHWEVIKKITENNQVASLYLQPTDAERPSFIAGQYLTIKLPGLTPAEGKAYSISSAPHESLLRVTIKQIGAFSSTLIALKPGSILTTSTPYGFFYPEPDEKAPLTFLVGGIGITPVISIIKDLTHKKDTRPLRLLYSNQSLTTAIFTDELQELASQHTDFKMQHFLTRENTPDPAHQQRRFSAKDILTLDTHNDTTEYFLCGSVTFVRDMWRDLTENNIPQHQLYTEGFF